MTDAAPPIWLPPPGLGPGQAKPAIIRPIEHKLLRPGFLPASLAERRAAIKELVARKVISPEQAKRALIGFFVPAVGWAAEGGNDAFTKLLVHCNGADASTTFTDSSASAHTITANGNAQVDTAQSKFGGASALFDGTNDYLISDASADFNMQTAGDWVVDFWVRCNGVGAGDQTFVDIHAGSAGLHIKRTGSALIVDNTLAGSLSAGTLITLTWHHIAAIRSSTTIYLALDGVIIDSDTAQNYGNANGTVYIGALNNIAEDFNGHIDELRISRGTDRGWTSGFTPPTAAYF